VLSPPKLEVHAPLLNLALVVSHIPMMLKFPRVLEIYNSGEENLIVPGYFVQPLVLRLLSLLVYSSSPHVLE
jgi:hypothetical protein